MTNKLYSIRQQGMIIHDKLTALTAVGYGRSILHSENVGMKIDIIENDTGDVVWHMRSEIVEEERSVSPEKVLTLSTAHMPCEKPTFGSPRVVEHEYGFIVFTGGEEDVEDWFQPIWDHARRVKGCTVIMFDRDATIWEDAFKTYEW